MTYDKKRITSTIILGIALTIALVFTAFLLSISWSALQAEAQEQEEVAGSIALVFVGAIGIVLLVMVSAVVNVLSGVCLIFSIKNRQSTLKPIRIISYVMDGLFGFVIVATLVKIILLLIGI